MPTRNDAVASVQRHPPVQDDGRRLAAIVESAFDAIIAKTLDGEITSWNRAAEDLYGYSAEEAIGQPISIIVPDDKRDELTEILEALKRRDRVEPFETCRVAKDGRRLIVSLAISPIMDDNATVIGASAIARDITCRKRDEMCLATSRAVTRLLEEAPSFAAASTAILEQIASGLGYELGSLWVKDDIHDVLTRAESVVVHPTPKILAFDRMVRHRRIAVGERLQGRVWETGRALLLEDVSAEAGDSFDSDARTAGIRSAMAFPIDAGDRFHGVMSFFTTQRVAPDETFQGRIAALGAEIGGYIRHMKTNAENANLAAIIESSNDAIIGWSTDGIITSWNPQATRIFGRSAEKTIGASVFEIIPADQVRRARRLYKKLIRVGRSDALGEISLTRHGRNIRLSLAFSPIRDHDGALIGFSTIARDVTAQRKAEADLRRAKEDAERANRAKSEFLATMCHEIRTPLHGVLSTADLLLASETTPQQQEYMEIVRDSGEQVLHLLNDLLELSKIEAGHLELKERDVDPWELLDIVAMAWKQSARSKGLQFFAAPSPHLPRRMTGDDLRIRQVLENLISNAIKYTDQGRVAVAATVERTRDGGKFLKFEVTDTGQGIEPEIQRRLFTRFERGKIASEDVTEGNGLGLAICKQIVERMGGEIGLESTPKAGSTFWFTVPIGPVKARANGSGRLADPNPDTGRAEAAASLRVLVADDNATNRKLLLDILSLAGHSVDLAHDGAEAVEAARRMKYDLIFMDIRMPEKDGVVATREIRSTTEGGDSIPIVAVTANAMRGDRERYLAAGLTDYLAKPFNMHDVMIAVSKATAAPKDPVPPN